jgi:hypothetical protein
VTLDLQAHQPSGLPWTETPDKTECTTNRGNVLHCDIASLRVGAAFPVQV